MGIKTNEKLQKNLTLGAYSIKQSCIPKIRGKPWK
jgi:hypothetical protein